MRIAIPVFQGVDELDAIAPYEILRSAASEPPGLEVVLCALDAPSVIEGAHGLRIEVRDAIPSTCDWVIVPGGGWTRGDQGVRAQIAQTKLARELQRLRATGASVASVCTGAMLLSAAGFLRGRPCTTHQVARDALEKNGGVLVDARVVDDGDVITAGGVTSGIDLALHLIARLCGEEAAQRASTRAEHPRTASIWTRR
ncbi:DJ-1/PfpI family protein [Sandaracinus amylolyticus]|nr:DJ-1/PfpI family protein [Sandaracinus amylolyticus]